MRYSIQNLIPQLTRNELSELAHELFREIVVLNRKLEKTRPGKTHGLSKSKFYKVWCEMNNRCERNPHYLKRGIRVCPRWKIFQNFMEDMFPAYLLHKQNNETTTIDRVDNLKNYEPQNCRWATRKEQQNNLSNNVYLKFRGVEKSLQIWAKEVRIDPRTISTRLSRGWSIKRALTTPIYAKKRKKLGKI